MSKSVLVMDMPSSCLECPLRYESEEISLGNFSYQKLFRCKCEPENISEDNGDIVFLNDIMMESKPDWCPLRELPERANHPDWCDGGRYDKATTLALLNC